MIALRTFSSRRHRTELSLTQLGDHRRILAKLIVEFLVHPDQKDVVCLDVVEGKREFLPNPVFGTDGASGRKDFEDDTGFGGILNQSTHSVAMFAEIDFTEGRIAEFSFEFLLRTLQIVEGGHVIVDVPIFLFGNIDDTGIMYRQTDHRTGVSNALEDIL